MPRRRGRDRQRGGEEARFSSQQSRLILLKCLIALAAETFYCCWYILLPWLRFTPIPRRERMRLGGKWVLRKCRTPPVPSLYPEDAKPDIPAERRLSRRPPWITWFMKASLSTDGLQISGTSGKPLKMHCDILKDILEDWRGQTFIFSHLGAAIHG